MAIGLVLWTADSAAVTYLYVKNGKRVVSKNRFANPELKIAFLRNSEFPIIITSGFCFVREIAISSTQ